MFVAKVLVSYSDGNEFREYRVQFWNLTTRILSEDSPPLSLHWNHYKLGFNLVMYGFGYDKWSDTYKMVIVLLDAKSENWEFKVHCLGDTCWTGILTCPAFLILGEANGQFVNGTVNWRAIRNSDLDYELETITLNTIFSYDLSKERHEYLLMPDSLEVSDDPDLGVLKGCLSIFYDHKETHFVVWLMREFGVQKSSTQLLNVTYEHLQVFSLYILVCPIFLSVNDDVIVLVICQFPFRFIYYNPRDNRIYRTEDCNDKVPLYSYDYVQSLVLLFRT